VLLVAHVLLDLRARQLDPRVLEHARQRLSEQVMRRQSREIDHITTRSDDAVTIADQQYRERVERAMRDDDLVAKVGHGRVYARLRSPDDCAKRVIS
jgi:hypothetical protein